MCEPLKICRHFAWRRNWTLQLKDNEVLVVLKITAGAWHLRWRLSTTRRKLRLKNQYLHARLVGLNAIMSILGRSHPSLSLCCTYFVFVLFFWTEYLYHTKAIRIVTLQQSESRPIFNFFLQLSTACTGMWSRYRTPLLNYSVLQHWFLTEIPFWF